MKKTLPPQLPPKLQLFVIQLMYSEKASPLIKANLSLKVFKKFVTKMDNFLLDSVENEMLR